MRRLFGIFCCFALCALSACNSGEPWKDPGPKEVFDAFLMHWFRGESKQAFQAVLPADRKKLVAPLEAASLPESERPDPWKMLVVADVQDVYDISRMELKTPLDKAPKDGAHVTLILHHQDGTKSHATLTWSGGHWYVDLPLDGSTGGKRG